MTRFYKYCRDKNILLLEDDKKFIRKLVIEITRNEKRIRDILFKYATIYEEARDNERYESKKQNTGRTAANRYLYKLSRN